MKKVIILLTTVVFLSGCSESSDDRIVSLNPIDSNRRPVIGTPPNRTGGGSTTVPATPGFTPSAYGENTLFPESDIQLAFQTNANGQVFSEGEIRLYEGSGYLGCILPAGTYTLVTSIPGNEKPTVHNFGGITLSATGPVLFTAVLENSLSRQNPDGEWVMHADLKVKSVGGVSCSNSGISLSFGMPI